MTCKPLAIIYIKLQICNLQVSANYVPGHHG